MVVYTGRLTLPVNYGEKKRMYRVATSAIYVLRKE